MVLFTLRYFAGPESPRYVLFTVGYAWFCSLSIIILVPADSWTTLLHHENAGTAFFWSWSYWTTFLLTCAYEGAEKKTNMRFHPRDLYIPEKKLINYYVKNPDVSYNTIGDNNLEGYSIIGTLVNASLLEKDENGEVENLKMHDVIRDMAL